MSFLEHLDELRSRLIRSIAFVFIACSVCWFVSDRIYNFLAVPVERALAEAQRHQVPIAGLTGHEAISSLNSLKEGDTGRYLFPQETRLGTSVIPVGASVTARVAKDAQGELGLFTDEPLYAGNTVISKGVRLPVDFKSLPPAISGVNDKLIVTSALEPFSLYIKVSLYAAICLSVPFLLWQIWAFVVLTAGETLVSPTHLEFSYTQGPVKLKSLIMCTYLLAVSLGNAFTAVVNWVIQNPDGTVKLQGTSYFMFFVWVMLGTAVLFAIVTPFYKGRTYLQDQADAPPAAELAVGFVVQPEA